MTLLGLTGLAYFWANNSDTFVLRAPASEVFGFNRFSDKHYLTLNTQQKVIGPILSQTDPNGKATEFYSKIFDLTVHNAHRFVSHLEKAKDFESYKIFILSSLVVSYHESFWSHFRLLEPESDRCHVARNDGSYIENVKSLGERDTKIFKENFEKHFLVPLNEKQNLAPVVDCKDFNPLKPAIQLIGTSDGIGFGIYQMSMRFGFVDEYFLPRKYLSLDDSINYGVDLIYKGFNFLRKNQGKYECLYDANGILNKHKFIRGLWAGMFNGRGSKDICRFVDLDNKWAKNDLNFNHDYTTFVNPLNSPILDHLSEQQKKYFVDLVELEDSEPLKLAAPQLQYPVNAEDFESVGLGKIEITQGKTEEKIKEKTEDKADDNKEVKETEYKKMYVAVEMLNLREGPSHRTRIKKVLYLNDEVLLIPGAEQNGWFRVKAGTDVGWLNSKYIRE